MHVCIIITTSVSNPAFFFLLRTSHGTLHTLKQHLNENGLTPRHRRKAPRTNKKFVTSEDIKSVLTFITNYAEVHGISLPGRHPGHKDYSLKLLPSNMTKASVWRLYKAAMEDGRLCDYFLFLKKKSELVDRLLIFFFLRFCLIILNRD